MIFFYKNNIGVGRTKFKHVEIDKKISEAIQRSNQSEKHEASTLKGRCSSLSTIKLRDFICLMCFRTEIVVNYRNSQFYYNSADKKIKDVLNEREVQAFNILSNRIVIEVQ